MRQKQRLRHKAQRWQKHPRSRQGWVLLHPMFPMSLKEYCGECYSLEIKLQERAKVQRFRGLHARIRRKQKDFPTSDQLWNRCYQIIARRVREESWKTTH